MKLLCTFLSVIFLCLSCQAQVSQVLPKPPQISGDAQEVSNQAVRLPTSQFRAVWIATVKNMDWPSKPGLPIAQQMQEARAYLDKAVELNLNAIIFQVRPHCDAFYRSDLEPWSYYLTGQEGKDPGYDPLQFWITEAHKRGLELHAWFNPFRAKHPAMKSAHSPKSIVARRPHWKYNLKNGYEWLDPGMKENHDFSKAVILDVLRRYDVDGIHLDDYFYPYPEYSKNGEFPDWQTYQKYKNAGGTLSHKDWRRNNIDEFVKDLHFSIKKFGRAVRFGISPFGIWRPNHPKGIKGLDVYDVLSADSKKWINNGWVDYIAPQLYWSNKSVKQNFTRLVDWWRQQNLRGKDIYPGLACYKVKDWPDGSKQLVEQINVIEQRADVRGFIHFNMKTIYDSPYMQKVLKAKHPSPALIPPLGGYRYATFAKKLQLLNGRLTWQTQATTVRRWLLTVGPNSFILPGYSRGVDLNRLRVSGRVQLFAIGPSGIIGPPMVIENQGY
ncbi:MAG: family 10 glycosylhydrolase [Lentisphaeraceae bacterium]|nr:family 10 glycosylhydrolase [Lentisphaeraceae bacterium]